MFNIAIFICDIYFCPLFVIWRSYPIEYILGMGRYQKCVHQEVTNAEPYRFQDSLSFSAPQPNMDVSCK